MCLNIVDSNTKSDLRPSKEDEQEKRNKRLALAKGEMEKATMKI